ncbi:hypothetical protein [Pseudorhodoferax aquiterrae]|nr:hypothetical protein [Pseudorhodoferax aquiterrae]
MAKSKPKRFDDAAKSWVLALPLSASAAAAYAAEAKRLSEYCASRRVADLRSFRGPQWLDYLRSLTSARDYLSPPRKALKASSALQAMRITRAFLTYCMQRGWISWDPGELRMDPSPVIVRPPVAELPVHVRQVVAGGVHATSEREARRHFVVALSFWGCLKPWELAALQVRHLSKDRALLSCPHRHQPVELPPPVADLWTRYEECRSVRSKVRPSSPLVASVRSSAAVSAWSIWAILNDAAAMQGVGSRRLRAAYATLTSAAALRDIDLVRVQAGKGGARRVRGAQARDRTRQLNASTLERLRGGRVQAAS